jgi:hypothetical protein
VRTFTLNGWDQSVVVEGDDGSATLTLNDAGLTTTLVVTGAADLVVTLDAPSEHLRPSSLEIEASAPAPKES